MAIESTEFQAPIPDEVAICAYLIWEREGRPLGREKEHWIEAETQLLACRAHDKWTGGTDRRDPLQLFTQ